MLHQTKITGSFNQVFKLELSLTRVSMIVFSGHGEKL